MNNIFLPKEIHVGFQERNGTYTGKLAYIIYKDEKGKLRKEWSWNGWRDEKIAPMILANTPTEGFVLNKKAGGYSTGWNHRQTYTRVYDPRGFEFEITVENLLYILENTNSIKGKGLEGEFVYGWSGKDLILIPTSSPDYVEISKLNEIIHKNQTIKAKDLKIGATYLTKQNEEWTYLGKFDYYDYNYSYVYENKNEPVYYKKCKKFYFGRVGQLYYTKEPIIIIETISSMSNKIINVVDENCASNFSELYEVMEKETHYSPVDYSKTQFINYSKEYIENKLNEGYKNIDCFIRYKDKYVQVNIHWHESKSDWQCPKIETKLVVASSIYFGKYIYDRFDTVEELLNTYDLMYRKLYLENGNFYKQDGGEI